MPDVLQVFSGDSRLVCIPPDQTSILLFFGEIKREESRIREAYKNSKQHVIDRYEKEAREAVNKIRDKASGRLQRLGEEQENGLIFEGSRSYRLSSHQRQTWLRWGTDTIDDSDGMQNPEPLGDEDTQSRASLPQPSAQSSSTQLAPFQVDAPLADSSSTRFRGTDVQQPLETATRSQPRISLQPSVDSSSTQLVSSQIDLPSIQSQGTDTQQPVEPTTKSQSYLSLSQSVPSHVNPCNIDAWGN
ncbi:hypothetical protein MMC10_007618 [Thelotrema lepadinum]|nr:hypothetical protein [Thelotrema lepadinum]